MNSWVSVDTYEMVLISLILVVFLTGVLGNSLVVIAVTTTKSMQGGQMTNAGEQYPVTDSKRNMQ